VSTGSSTGTTTSTGFFFFVVGARESLWERFVEDFVAAVPVLASSETDGGLSMDATEADRDDRRLPVDTAEMLSTLALRRLNLWSKSVA
jgi:hypothetical protein